MSPMHINWPDVKLATGIISDVISILIGGAAIWHVRMYFKDKLKKTL